MWITDACRYHTGSLRDIALPWVDAEGDPIFVDEDSEEGRATDRGAILSLKIKRKWKLNSGFGTLLRLKATDLKSLDETGGRKSMEKTPSVGSLTLGFGREETLMGIPIRFFFRVDMGSIGRS